MWAFNSYCSGTYTLGYYLKQGTSIEKDVWCLDKLSLFDEAGKQQVKL